ncbi:MAG TPA: helix-turn-helix transcriptional regulator [Candidatus Binatia bacterium]|nr:helix-turn-helix transcriptional regulator [Candidatus Binatia bacterium]
MSHRYGLLDRPTRDALVALGAVLRELRLERGLSQRSLAARAGLSQATVSRLEAGKAAGVRAAWIARLLAGLDEQTTSQPDDQHLLERNHGFRKLRAAFDAGHGAARARARELERRRSVAELLLRHDIEQRDRELKAALEWEDAGGRPDALMRPWLDNEDDDPDHEAAPSG